MPSPWTAPSLLPSPDPSAGVIRWDMAVNNVMKTFRDAQEFQIRKEELAIKREQAVLELANSKMRNETIKLEHELIKARNSPEMLKKQLELESAKIDTAKMQLQRESHTMKSSGLIEGIVAQLDLDIETGNVADYNTHKTAFMKSPDYKNLTMEAQAAFKGKLEQDRSKVFSTSGKEVVTWGEASQKSVSSPLVRATEFEENRFVARKKLEAANPYASKEQIDALVTGAETETAMAVRQALTGTTIAVKEQEKRDIQAGRMPTTTAGKIGVESTPGIVQGLSGASWLDKLIIKSGAFNSNAKVGPVMDEALNVAKANIASVDVGNDPTELARKQMLLNRIDRIKPLIRDIGSIPTLQSHGATFAFGGPIAGVNFGTLREVVAIPARIRIAMSDDMTVEKVTKLNDLLNAYTALPEDSDERISMISTIQTALIDTVSGFVGNEEMTTVNADLARLRATQGETTSSQPQKKLYINKRTGDQELR